MLWIVQNNLANEPEYDNFIDALMRFELPYIVVKPVPFSHKLLPADFDSMTQDADATPEPTIDASLPIMVCGTITLNKIAIDRGWKPGTFLNDNFDFEVWRYGFDPRHVLNRDACTTAIRMLHESLVKAKGQPPIFIRPTKDTKAFTGRVFDRDEAMEFCARAQPGDPVTPATQVLFASVKKIYSEWRLFVVDGQIVTGSQYKQGNRTLYNRDVDQAVLDFGQRMVDHWQPADAFVIDIADTEEGRKVIEINNINSAGFYAADPQRIVHAIEKLFK